MKEERKTHRSAPVLGAVLLTIMLTGCNYFGGDTKIEHVGNNGISGGEFSFYSTVCSAHTGSATLYWDAPTTFSDGTLLAPTDITGFHVYYGTSMGIYTLGDYLISDPTASSVNTESFLTSGATGTYYFVITAVYPTSEESSYSNEVCKVISN